MPQLYLGLLLAAVAIGPVAAGERDEASTPANGRNKSVFDKWFGGKDKEEPPAKVEPKKKDDLKGKETTSQKPKETEPTPQEMAATRSRQIMDARVREESALLRRLAVCDKLMEIAIRNNDMELARKVEQLDERARKTYSERTASFASSDKSLDGDLQIIEKHLGPSASTSVGKLSSATGTGGERKQAAAKEVRP